jgi:hypothetical protein
MRRPRSVRAVTAALLLAVLAVGCSNDHTASRPTTSTTATLRLHTVTPSGSTSVPDVDDPALRATQVQASDLGTGFIEDTSSNNTVTSFCFAQDATHDLRATARAYVGYGRAPAGVLQLTFRFRKGDAERFVAQADQMFSSCNEVPDIQGQAYTYQPVTRAVDATLASTDGHTARYGVSVGNGNLTEEVAVFRKGDIGVLIAVVTYQVPRADTDALATKALTAAVRRAPSK